MEQKKNCHEITKETPHGNLIIRGPVIGAEIENLKMDDGLNAFRSPKQQKEAVTDIANLPEGRVIIAIHEDTIIGYVTFLYPDPLERWSQANMDNLLELGAIEVSSNYRHIHVGEDLLKVAFLDDAMEDFIIYTTEYYWHWDLKNTKLSIWDYRKIMEKMMSSAGLEWFATDDPEICSHPANCLMVRIGKRVPLTSIEEFDHIRFMNRFMY